MIILIFFLFFFYLVALIVQLIHYSIVTPSVRYRILEDKQKVLPDTIKKYSSVVFIIMNGKLFL